MGHVVDGEKGEAVVGVDFWVEVAAREGTMLVEGLEVESRAVEGGGGRVEGGAVEEES